MKARLEGGKVVKYNTLPETFNINGKHYVNFRSASESELEDAGFFDVVTPTFDEVTHEIHNLHFEGAYEDPLGTRAVFVYDVREKTISQTVEELKEQRINELNKIQFSKLEPTDFYVWRKMEKGTAIPSSVQTERDNIRSQASTKEDEINALATKEALLRYDVNF